jgi:pimeloyl-ACP methyl ester carboxylesterase
MAVETKIDFGLLRAGPHDAAETLLFLHGWAGSKELWRHTLALMPRQYRTIALDLPGTGGTPLPMEMQTIPQMAHWVAGVCTRLGLADVTLIGRSLGGNLAAEICLLYPRLVRRLVMADAALDPHSLPIRARWPLRHPFGLAALAALRVSMAPLALLGHFVPAESQVGLWHGQARRCYWYVRANPSDRLLRVQLQALSDNPLLAARLSGLTLPILILHGERDPLVPVAQAHELARTLCHARLVTFPQGHHSPMDDDPEGFAQAIADFCAAKYEKQSED